MDTETETRIQEILEVRVDYGAVYKIAEKAVFVPINLWKKENESPERWKLEVAKKIAERYGATVAELRDYYDDYHGIVYNRYYFKWIASGKIEQELEKYKKAQAEYARATVTTEEHKDEILIKFALEQ